MLRGVKVWTKCSKKQKSLKLINVQPIFWDYEGLLVIVGRECGKIGEVKSNSLPWR